MKVKHCLAILFLIISFQIVEALLEEAQEDITPEVGSEVILVDEAGETPGTPWSFSCITSTTFSFAVPDAIRAQLCTFVAFLRKKNNKPISVAHVCKLIEINRLLANSVKLMSHFRI